MTNKENLRFVGTGKNNHSNIFLYGIPLDKTETFRSGTKAAPSSIRKYSDSIESFSPFFKKDILDLNIYDAGDIDLDKVNLKNALKKIETLTFDLIKKNKKFLFLGGEHLITLPIVKSLYKKYKKLKIIYFDAHADMRDTYDGEKLSHATVARRIVEIVGSNNIFLYGIRSCEKGEYNYILEKKIKVLKTIRSFSAIIEKIKNYPVYISFDLDAFDSSCIPGVSNPEAGGIFYNDFENILKSLLKLKNIIGIDVVELLPGIDITFASDIFAAKVVREFLILLGNKNEIFKKR